MNSSGTHTVLRLTDRKSRNSLTEFRELRPWAGKGEVLVKDRSVALNFPDLAIATGTYAHPVKDRVIPGSDAAGDIVMVGKDVRGFAIGDKVVIAYDQMTRTGPIKSCQRNALLLVHYVAVGHAPGPTLEGQSVAFPIYKKVHHPQAY
ncbi:uncharacterized protein N7515_003397 [Penicillium bovifimosum]|uniref:Alcohol dehydrogenase-like N-terminal domain-containing protein n=1 Tax=Penicillium bovifimosum TaxID=126998 RepID=A0A9W9H4M5_9EURO|nr:uncharacterized protein N7515_003397 [Penicillium bovifimosum]KAJ5138549.1 hypothetical protein N7515_003397 [Penicillium bovifimosum]